MTLLLDLSPELVFELTKPMSAAEAARFLSCNKALHSISLTYVFWLDQVQKLVRHHYIAHSSIDIATMTLNQLRELSIRPYRFQRALMQGSMENLSSSCFTHVIRDPQDQSNDCVEAYLIPGGRWLVTLFKNSAQMLSLKIWDMKDAANEKIALAAKNGRGTLSGPIYGMKVTHDEDGPGARIFVRAEASHPRRNLCLVALQFDPTDSLKPLKLINVANITLDLLYESMVVQDRYVAINIGGKSIGILTWDWKVNRLRIFIDQNVPAPSDSWHRFRHTELISFNENEAYMWDAGRAMRLCRLTWKEPLTSTSRPRTNTINGNNRTLVERIDSAETSWSNYDQSCNTSEAQASLYLARCLTDSRWTTQTQADFPTLSILYSHEDAPLVVLGVGHDGSTSSGMFQFPKGTRITRLELTRTISGHALLCDSSCLLTVFELAGSGSDGKHTSHWRLDRPDPVGLARQGKPFICPLTGTIGWVRPGGTIELWQFK